MQTEIEKLITRLEKKLEKQEAARRGTIELIKSLKAVETARASKKDS